MLVELTIKSQQQEYNLDKQTKWMLFLHLKYQLPIIITHMHWLFHP